VSYVDAGYAIALGTVFVYAISLLVRRRRWDRALSVKESTPDEGPPTAERL
jgi:hypothetical protein